MTSANFYHVSLFVSFMLSCVGFLVTFRIIPMFNDMFIRVGLFRIDMAKPGRVKIPESQGVICGTVFLIIMFIFIPVPFYKHFAAFTELDFPHHEYSHYIAALLSICCMVFLGFADDVLDLKWRYKLLFPVLASLPLLMVYFVNWNATMILVPKPLHALLGHRIDLGLLYYLYMSMLAVFCTNAINIFAGLNGLEAGQSLIIAISIIIFNLMEISGKSSSSHIFSLYFLMPFTAVNLALLYYNWYPSRVFVGDTFCYFAGMTFAVISILGHFSETMLMFFIPQIFNFVYSIPQLFKFVPCPRHRLPKYNQQRDVLTPSYCTFKSKEVGLLGRMVLTLFRSVRLADVTYRGHRKEQVTCSNFTLINIILRYAGPMHERRLVRLILIGQICCCGFSFLVRYQLRRYLYDV